MLRLLCRMDGVQMSDPLARPEKYVLATLMTGVERITVVTIPVVNATHVTIKMGWDVASDTAIGKRTFVMWRVYRSHMFLPPTTDKSNFHITKMTHVEWVVLAAGPTMHLPHVSIEAPHVGITAIAIRIWTTVDIMLLSPISNTFLMGLTASVFLPFPTCVRSATHRRSSNVVLIEVVMKRRILCTHNNITGRTSKALSIKVMFATEMPY